MHENDNPLNNRQEGVAADQIESLRSAYGADPTNLETASRLAQIYTDKGWLNEAIEVYKNILPHMSENYPLLLEYGNVCFRHQDFEDAATLFQKLTALKPQRVEGWNNLGIARLSLHDDAGALEAFRKVLELEPDNAGALLNLGNCQSSIGKFDDAIALFSKVVSLRPDFADGWFNMGNAYCSTKQYPEAIAAFEKAIKYQREFPSALKNMGFAYEQIGNIEAALDNYKKALELNKGDASLYVNIANVYIVQKQYDEAKGHYLQAVKLSPKEIAGWMGLRHLALFKGDIETYAKSTLAVAGRIGQKALAESLLVLRELGHFDNVDEILCRADDDDIAGDEIDAERLLAYQRTDSYPGKIRAILKRLRAIPVPSDHLCSCLARYEYEIGEFSGTKRRLESMADLQMSDHKLLWRTCIALEQWDKAQELLREYLDGHNDCFDAWYFLAKVKLAGNEADAAREFLVKALEFGFSDMDALNADPDMKNLFESLKTTEETTNGGTA